jgi:signal transduction histidine kinase
MRRLRHSQLLLWAVAGVAAALAVGGMVLEILNLSAPSSDDWGSNSGRVLAGITFLSFSLVGALIGTLRPGHTVAWICLAIGFVASLFSFAGGYGDYTLTTNPEALPGGRYMAWLENWTWVVWLGLSGVFLLLLFPDGRLPSRRWRLVAWLSVVGIVAVAVSEAFTPGPLDEDGGVVNPLGIEGAEDALEALSAGLGLLGACVLASAASVVLRFRRARGEERLQLEWFATAAAAVSVTYCAAVVLGQVASDNVSAPVQDASVLSVIALPIAVGIAILKYRLYGIDVVINKAVVFAALAVFITAVYVAIVVGLGAALGTVGEPNIVLSILATAVVAVAFQPARERAQRFANRLVYGKRATPYEVLAEFSDRVAETYATEEVLPNMARTIAEGTGAQRADVWLRAGSELRLAASWPVEAPGSERPLILSNGQLPAFSKVDRAVAVRHQNDLLGALTVVKPSGEPLTATEDRLLADLASQAGLVLRNVGLASELVARLEELAASRQRLVAAQDEERRRLERNLHDGAQQHLVALKVRLDLAARMAEGDQKLRETLESLSGATEEAVEALRDLARGIYPPLLADQGLAAALTAHARKVSVPVAVEAEGLSRYSQEVEAAVYFCCLEALQNVAKYAQAGEAVVRIDEVAGSLQFSVQDDGAGFDPARQPRGSGLQNMADRLAALGGSLEIRSAPNSGTTIIGELPTEPQARRAPDDRTASLVF